MVNLSGFVEHIADFVSNDLPLVSGSESICGASQWHGELVCQGSYAINDFVQLKLYYIDVESVYQQVRFSGIDSDVIGFSAETEMSMRLASISSYIRNIVDHDIDSVTVLCMSDSKNTAVVGVHPSFNINKCGYDSVDIDFLLTDVHKVVCDVVSAGVYGDFVRVELVV